MKIKKDVNWTQVKEKFFLTHLKDDIRFFHEINPTGSIIWEGLKDELDVQEIAEKIMQEYNVGESEILADIHEFCDCLKELNLIEDV